MTSETRRFRPMGAMDILDEVVDIYKSNFALLLGVAAILYVPMSIISGLTADRTASSTRIDWAVLAMVPFEAIVTGALAFGISERYLGKSISIADCYRRILRLPMLLPLVGAILIKYTITIGPLVTLMLVFPPHIPRDPSRVTPEVAARLLAWSALMLLGMLWMFLLSMKLLLVESALVIERKGALASIARSWKATRGSFWKSTGIFALVLLVWLIVYSIIALPVQIPISQKVAIGEPVSASALWLLVILTTIITTLGVPVTSATRILIYYDIRIRKEAFDLEILAGELDRKAKETSAGDITALPQERASAREPSERESG